MAAESTRVTRARRALGAELAHLRTLAGLSIRKFGDRTAAGGMRRIPHARIPRIESGEAVPTADQVWQWFEVTDAGDAVRERVNALRAEVVAENVRWSELLEDAPGAHLQRLAAEREQAATTVDVFCHQWLPGLVQTGGYAYALFSMLHDKGYRVDVPVSSDQRMRRQEILHEPGRTFRFVVTRRALTWNPDPDAVSMPAQLSRIREIASLPSSEVRVLEDDAGPVAGWASFTVYDGDRAFVAIELPHRSLLALDEDDVAWYRTSFDDMWAAAEPLDAR